jgi:hypothetical protein
MRRRPLHDHVESGTRISRTLSDDHAHRGKSDDRSVALLPSSSAPSARRNAALELAEFQFIGIEADGADIGAPVGRLRQHDSPRVYGQRLRTRRACGPSVPPACSENDAYRHMQRSGVSRLKLLGRHCSKAETAAQGRSQRRGQRRRARLCANTAIASPKARGRPASRRTSSTVDVLALRHPSNGTVVTVAPWRRKTPRPSG